MVLTLNNAVHSVLFLILVFFNISGLLLLLGTEFFAFLFLIVYVGAIAVLFLFVIMMLNIKYTTNKSNISSILPLGSIVFIYLFILITAFICNHFIPIKKQFINYIFWVSENLYLTNTEVLGLVLYTKYSLLFLICSLILLISMIGAIVLTMHQRSSVKKQHIGKQLLRNQKNIIKFLKLRK